MRLIGVLVITMVEHRGFNLAMFVGLVGFVLVYAFHQMLCLRSEYVPISQLLSYSVRTTLSSPTTSKSP